MKKSVKTLAFVAVLAASLSGCSAPSYSKESIAPYFAAMASEKPEQIAAAVSSAAPGSNAEAYLLYYGAAKQAQLEGGQFSKEVTEVVYEPNGVSLCLEGYKSAGVDKSSLCSSYTNFKFVDGKLSDFSAGDKPLEGRIFIGNGKQVPIGNMGSVKLIAAYLTIAGDLAIVTEMTSKTDKLQIPYNAIYFAPNGRQINVSREEGVSDLKNGRTGNVAYYFSGAALGGTLELPFTDSDWNEILVSIPTK